MATSSFYFSFGMGQRHAAESVEAGQEVGNKPKMGKKFSHVVSEVDAHRFNTSFSREKCRGFLKSRSVSWENSRVILIPPLFWSSLTSST